MKKVKKIFLPKWIRWFIVPVYVGIWALITYSEFFNSTSKGELGLFGYIIMSAIFIGVGVMIWLMSGGKLPAYIMVEEDESDKN